jgi:HAMP domain-containing protein
MLTVKAQPVTDTLYRAKAPRLKTKTRFQIRNLVSRLVVQIQLHSISVREQAAAGIRLLALIALAVAGIAAVMAWRLKARLEAPIERIYRVLGRALDGDLQRRTGLGNNDEISRIGMRVDRLLDRLERNDLNRMHSLRPTGANYHAPEKVIDETGEELPVEEEPLPIDESRQASLPMTMIHQLPEDE